MASMMGEKPIWHPVINLANKLSLSQMLPRLAWDISAYQKANINKQNKSSRPFTQTEW